MKIKMLHVLSTLLFSLNQWLQVILITRVIGLYEIGLFSYFLAIAGPLVLFSRFSFSDLVPTQKKYNYGYSIFFKYRNIMNMLFLLLIIILAVLFDFSTYEAVCFMLFGIYKFYETKEDFIYTENIAESNIKFLAYSKIIKSIITAVLFAAGVFIAESLLAAILSLLVSQMIIYYLYDKKFTFINRSETLQFGRKHFKHIFWLGIGLSLVGLLSSLNANIPRYFLEYYFSVEVLGIYATIMYFATISLNIVITINQSLIAELARTAAQNIRAFYNFFIKIMIFYLAAIMLGNIILFLYGSQLLVFIYGNDFLGFERELMLLGIFISLIVIEKTLEMVMNIFNLYNIQVVFQIINIVLTTVLSIIFIIPYGISGAFAVAIVTGLFVVAGQIAAIIYKNSKLF
ncbi:hypothetical protein E4T89_02460 [Jeotgalicoccus nanhaiensis]|uniref:Oligosaccharide flippase family protein n=1 Tax=Jeotgalicoccus nanhaiensis TaxID=568603 RepID=A0ABR9XVT2_9STAP|nr:oligosaccharide flippase family protein [Jeotgalicoccus nanhaiensis]MBF0753119.1 oligosaccharide flippase family protein [Jeotgalicoccus nanhaiensis]TFU62292.1 hypothetical protein E4T89_02460 [Jeotgalicoccus nanhaiensis]